MAVVGLGLGQELGFFLHLTVMLAVVVVPTYLHDQTVFRFQPISSKDKTQSVGERQ